MELAEAGELNAHGDFPMCAQFRERTDANLLQFR
jgi:hypothetical protein